MTAITFDLAEFSRKVRSTSVPGVVVDALIELARQENARQEEDRAFRETHRKELLRIEEEMQAHVRERQELAQENQELLQTVEEIKEKLEATERSVDRIMAQEPITREYLDLRLDAKFAEVKSEFREEMAETKLEFKEEMAQAKLEFKEDITESKVDIIKWTAGIIAVQSVGILIGCATIIKVFS